MSKPNYAGIYHMVSQENFEEYLAALGKQQYILWFFYYYYFFVFLVWQFKILWWSVNCHKDSIQNEPQWLTLIVTWCLCWPWCSSFTCFQISVNMRMMFLLLIWVNVIKSNPIIILPWGESLNEIIAIWFVKNTTGKVKTCLNLSLNPLS